MAAVSPRTSAPTELLAVDDNMEISSDAGRQQEDDIDIDIDFPADRVENADDDLMLEDDTGAAPHIPPNHDEVMADSDEDVQGEQDEVLRDASVEFDEDEHLDDPDDGQPPLLPAHQNTLATTTGLSESSVPQDTNFGDKRDFALEGHTTKITNIQAETDTHLGVLTIETTDANANSQPDDTTQDNRLLSAEDAVEHSVPNPKDSLDTEQLKPIAPSSPHNESLLENDQIQNDVDEANATLEEAADDDSSDDSDQQTEISTSHPTVIIYDNTEMHLFPPPDSTESQTFLLNDESLTNKSIDEMLRACRSVLGESLEGDDELELGIAVLGLVISEGSVHAAKCTFGNVLQAYVQLCHNDGIDDPGPLYVTLNTKGNFLARLQSLRASAAEGKGLSEIDFLHIDDDLYPTDHLADPAAFEVGTAVLGDGVEVISGHLDFEDDIFDPNQTSATTAVDMTQHQQQANITSESTATAKDQDDSYTNFETAQQPQTEHNDNALDPGPEPNDNEEGEEELFNEEGNDTIHHEDDLFDFGDEDAKPEQAGISSDSSTIQCDTVSTTAQNTSWESFEASVEQTSAHDDQQDDFEFLDEGSLHELEHGDLDEFADPQVAEQGPAAGPDEFSETHRADEHEEVATAETHGSEDEGFDDDINFADEDANNALRASTLDGDASTTQDLSNQAAADEEDLTFGDAQDHNQSSSKTTDIDPAAEVSAANGTTFPGDIVEAIQAASSDIAEIHDPPADDMIDYSDDEETVSENSASGAAGSKTENSLARPSTSSPSRKRSRVEEDNTAAEDEGSFESKKLRSS